MRLNRALNVIRLCALFVAVGIGAAASPAEAAGPAAQASKKTTTTAASAKPGATRQATSTKKAAYNSQLSNARKARRWQLISQVFAK